MKTHKALEHVHAFGMTRYFLRGQKEKLGGHPRYQNLKSDTIKDGGGLACKPCSFFGIYKILIENWG
jgi:hypothetical protein